MRILPLACLVLAACPAHASPDLEVSRQGPDLTFQLSGATGTDPWVLEHSVDGEMWEELLFFPETREGLLIPTLQVARTVLPDPEAAVGFFRAVQLGGETTFHRRFLSERAKWRLAGHNAYQYELQQWISFIFWRGDVEVADNEVLSFTTLEFYSPFPEIPEVPTIEGLFALIADAIGRNAEEITVTWHPTLGYPQMVRIDYDLMVADEERGWTINSFTPNP